MSKGLRNMSEKERKEAINRRIAGQTKGNGYWAAVDGKNKMDKSQETGQNRRDA